RALVLHRARLGRLLGLGSGRERRADAMAAGDGVHPLDHDPGEAGDAEDLERVADPWDRHDGDRRHVPGALGDPVLDSRLRVELGPQYRVRGADRGDALLIRGTGDLASRAAALRGPPRF